MLDIFLKNKSDIAYPIKSYPQFEYIKRKYKEELSKTINYYRYRDKAVRNNHMFTRLINANMANPDLSTVQFYKYIYASAKYIAKQFNIVDNINAGRVMDSVVYGRNSKEVFLYVESDIDFDDISVNWQRYAPVKIIYSNQNDINLLLPEQTVDFEIPTLTIMTLDPVLMCMQYREWMKMRQEIDATTNINIFVYQIVLPNMLKNLIDINIYNRFSNIVNGRTNSKHTNPHPFIFVDYTERTDRVLEEFYKDYRLKGHPIEKLYDTIPTIYNESMLDALHIEHRYFTRQSEWVLWLSRAKMVADMLKFIGEDGIFRNRDVLNKLPYMIRQFRLSRTIEGQLTDFLQKDFDNNIAYIEKIIGKR